MRKHFLILMLLALLPLAGFAAAEDYVSPDGVKFKETANAADYIKTDNPILKYTATEKALPVPAAIGVDAITEYVVSSAWYKTTVDANGNVVKTGSALEKLEDAGKYICEFQVNQGNHQGNHTAIFEIAKCKLTVTASDLTNGANQGDPQNALTYGDAFTADNVTKTFTGWPAAIDTDAKKEELINSFGTITYTTDYVPFESGVTTAGNEYDIVPIITGLVSDNYDFEAVHGKLQVVAKDLANGQFTVTVSPRFYDGTAADATFSVVDLANPGTPVADGQFGLLYYATSDATNAMASNPLHAGTYYVALKPEGNGNYTGEFAGDRSVYKIRPALLRFTLKNPEITYDGQAHNLAATASYDIDVLATGDQIQSLTVETQTYNKTKKEWQDYKTGNPAAFITNIKDYNEYGYKITSIVPTFTGGSKANAGDYNVKIETPLFKINQAKIEITFKNKTMQSDEAVTIKNGIAITGANADTYFAVVKAPVTGESITDYPNVKATKNAETGDWEIAFASGTPTVKDGQATPVVTTPNYEFKINKGILTINADLGILYVIPQNDVYGNIASEGFVKVKVVSADDSEAATAKAAELEEILNNDKVTIKPYHSDPVDQDKEGKLLDVTTNIEYPNAGTYTITFDEEVQETKAWLDIAADYNIDLNSRTTYIINKAPLKIKLNDQSLNGKTDKPAWDGDTKAALVADNKAVEFTGIVDVDLVDGEIPEAFYEAVHNNFKFDGAVTTKLTGDKLNADAITYNQEKVNDTDEATTPGYFRNAISVDAEHLVFANYKYNANEDVTKGSLYVSAYDNNFSLDEADDDVDETLEEANTNKKAVVKITLRRDQDLVSGEGADAQVLHHGKWAGKKWNTMVLPFDVTVAELSQQLGYAIVNVVNPEKTTGTNIAFRLEMNEIPANTPFTVKTNKGIGAEKVLTFENKTIKYVAEPSVEAGGQGYTFNANYAGLTIDKESDGLLKFLYGDLDGWGRVLADKDYSWDIMPFAAYIDLTEATDPNAAREVTFTMEEIDGSTTTIRNISVDTASKLKNATEGWYTIDGIRLQGAPTEKGIYINNGKKVVLK